MTQIWQSMDSGSDLRCHSNAITHVREVLVDKINDMPGEVSVHEVQ